MATTSTNMETAEKVLDLRTKRVWGLRCGIRGNAVFLHERSIGYIAGTCFVAHNLQDNVQRFLASVVPNRNVTCVALSGDRRFLAVSYVSCDDLNQPAVKVYDVQSWTERKSLRCRAIGGRDVVALAISSDGGALVAQGGAPDWQVVHWRWQTDRTASHRVSIDEGHPGAEAQVHQVSVHPDDSTLVCVCGTSATLLHLRVIDSVIKVSGKTKAAPEDRQVAYLCHAWLSDAQIVTGTSAATVVLWHVFTSRRKWHLPSPGAVSHVVRLVDGFACVQGPGDALFVFDKVGGAEEYQLTRTVRAPVDQGTLQPLTTFTALSASPSSERLVAVTSNSDVYSCTLSPSADGGATQDRFDVLFYGNGSGEVLQMDLCLRKPLLVTRCHDDCIRVFNYATGDRVARKRFSERVLSVAIHPLGLHLAVCLLNKTLFLSLLADVLRPAARLALAACHLCVFSNGGHLLAVAQGNAVHLVSTVTYQRMVTLSAHLSRVESVCWTSDDHRLMTCDAGGAAYEWRSPTGLRLRETVVKHCRFLDAIVSGSDDDLLVAVAEDDDALTQIDGAGKTRRAATPVTSIACVSNVVPPFVAIGCRGNNNARIYAVDVPLSDESRWCSFPSLATDVVKMKVDRGGRHLMTASSDGCVCVMDVTDRQGYPFRTDIACDFDNEEVLVSRQDLDDQTLKMAELEQLAKELRLENSFKERIKDMEHEEAIRGVRDQCAKRVSELEAKIQMLLDERLLMESTNERRMRELKAALEKESERLRAENHQKLLLEYEKYRQLQEEYCRSRRDAATIEEKCSDRTNTVVDDVARTWRRKLSPLRKQIQTAEKELVEERSERERALKDLQMEWNAQSERVAEGLRTELRAEKERNTRLNDALGALKRKLTVLSAQTDELKSEMRKASWERRRSQRVFEDLGRDAVHFNREIRDRDRLLQSKETRIHDLTTEVLRLEKINSVMGLRLEESCNRERSLNETVQNLTSTNESNRELMEIVKAELQDKCVSIDKMQNQVQVLKRLLHSEKQKGQAVKFALTTLKKEIADCCHVIHDGKLLKSRHAQFIARTVLVRNGEVEEAMRTLNRILGNEGIFERFRRNRFYEKPFQYRRRKNYETCRSLYDEDMSRKIALVMRKNRVDPFPGA